MDVILTCGVMSMRCSMMASPETQILVTVTTHQCKFTAHTLLHRHPTSQDNVITTTYTACCRDDALSP